MPALLSVMADITFMSVYARRETSCQQPLSIAVVLSTRRVGEGQARDPDWGLAALSPQDACRILCSLALDRTAPLLLSHHSMQLYADVAPSMTP